MEDIVILKNKQVTTTSLIISEYTGNQHNSVTKLIKKYIKQFKLFGPIDLKSTGKNGSKNYKTWYVLNEPQATLLMSFFDNTKKVVEFKVKLVQEFYKMKQILLNKENYQWLDARNSGKEIRHEFTDILSLFIDYAYSQGSKSANKYFMIYTKLVNNTLELKPKQRDVIGIATLSAISLLENSMGNIIITEMEKETYYKDIYKTCRDNCVEFMKGMYINKPKLLKAM